MKKIDIIIVSLWLIICALTIHLLNPATHDYAGGRPSDNLFFVLILAVLSLVSWGITALLKRFTRLDKNAPFIGLGVFVILCALPYAVAKTATIYYENKFYPSDNRIDKVDLTQLKTLSIQFTDNVSSIIDCSQRAKYANDITALFEHLPQLESIVYPTLDYDTSDTKDDSSKLAKTIDDTPDKMDSEQQQDCSVSILGVPVANNSGLASRLKTTLFPKDYHFEPVKGDFPSYNAYATTNIHEKVFEVKESIVSPSADDCYRQLSENKCLNLQIVTKGYGGNGIRNVYWSDSEWTVTPKVIRQTIVLADIPGLYVNYEKSADINRIYVNSTSEENADYTWWNTRVNIFWKFYGVSRYNLSSLRHYDTYHWYVVRERQ